MRWIANNWLGRVGALLQGLIAPSKEASVTTLHEIRSEMLAALGDVAEKHFPLVQLRVTYASDIDDFWYLRGDVMAAIASLRGEAVAKEKLLQISTMFIGLVPHNLTNKFPVRLS
ncbi:MAG: hypothetical protein U5L73_10875 [Rhodoferax sp.]|uniref:hypothetical protein n=1 Tax=Rhodoferax sp. TaxID=50421 RepID=UPI002ACE990A|nr:hypothetical protein [Rhodoferax sp.]MDZ7892243.1 hypothetical protein [Rhodoferax sp.]